MSQNSRDKTIRKAVAGLIRSVAPRAVVSHRWLPGHERKWIDLLRSKDDEDRVHAWCITQVKDDLDTDSGLAIPDRQEGDLMYRVEGWMEWYAGTEDDNSEDQFAAEREAIKDLLLKTPDLGIPEVVAEHNGITFESDQYDPAGVVVHFSKGLLVVGLELDLD